MIQLKSPREIETMQRGGRILAETMALLRREARAGLSTLDLDMLAEEFIRSHEGATPSFKGLYNVPATLCTSINTEIVHGIPSRKRVLQDGDIVSIDAGVRYQGYHTDRAITVAIGEVPETARRLLAATEEALWAGIGAARPGNHLGDVGAAIQAVVERAGFSVVRDLVGHGIGVDFHEEPQVPNYGKPKRGTKLVPGLTIAIEPMVNAGGPGTRTLPDRWTVVTTDGSRSAHFEHTVAVTEDGPLVLTELAAATAAVS